MPRKSATAVKDAQPDLLGGDRGLNATVNAVKATQVASKAKPIAKVAPKPKAKTELTVVESTPANTLAALIRAMGETDAANLQVVATLHKEMLAERSRLEYIEAMRELKRKLPVINKDGKIQFEDKGKGKPKPILFASFENIQEIIRPLLDEHGFDLWFSSEPGVAGMINVIGSIEHRNGYVRKTVLPMPHDSSGGKSGAQGWASAFSFGKRIATIGLLNIRTRAPEDRDLDGNRAKVTKAGKPVTVEGRVAVEDQRPSDEQVEVCSEDQLTEVRDAIAGCGVSDKAFCDHFEIKKVSQLPAASFQDALASCRSYAEKRK